jgi:hypothetical protein
MPGTQERQGSCQASNPGADDQNVQSDLPR